MKSHIYIHILAILLTFSMAAELGVHYHTEDAIALEHDSDNEEEKKEDKLRELTIALSPDSLQNMERLSYSRIYLQVLWEIPETDQQTPPPELA